MPAQLAWTNGTGNGLYGTAANWTDILGGPSVVPGSSDYIIMRAPGVGIPGSNTACLMNVSSAAVDRVMIESSYTAAFVIASGNTLTTNNQFVQYGDLELEGGATIDAGTYFDVNGNVFTLGFGSAATLTTTGDFFLNSGATITVPGFTPQLDIISTGFDDAGTITIGGPFSAGVMTITGTYVQTSAGVINIGYGSDLDFFTGGTDFPIIQGTINLVGDLATDTQLAISGGTLNSLGTSDNIAGDVGVYNSGVINVGTGGSGALTHTSGSMTIGALDPLSSPTGGTLNLYTSSTLSMPSAASSSTFIVFGEINMYGATISMTTSRVSQLELDGGTLNTYGAATVPATGDVINGNLLNNGLVEFLGSALHTLAIGSIFGGGNYTQDSGGTLAMRLNNSSVCDQLTVASNLTLDGTLSLTGVTSLNTGQTWNIIPYLGTLTNDFATIIPADGAGTWQALLGPPYAVSK